MNSALQCLTYTPPLANLMLEKTHQGRCKKSGYCTFCELERLINHALSRPSPSIRPIKIAQNLKCIAPHLRIGRQEDSHEFIRYVIEHLQTSEARSKTEVYQTAVFHIFGGFLQSVVTCSRCKYESKTVDPILDLSLEIQNCSSVDKALQKFFSVETLDVKNKYKCDSCKQSVQAAKQFAIYRASNVLSIQLKRFGILGNKINHPVHIPPELDIGKYMSVKNGARHLYDLYAVLVHSGPTTNSGHYFSYVKNSSNIWYKMDDRSVSEVSLTSVLQQKAYLLFYVRQETSQPLPAPPKPDSSVPSTPPPAPAVKVAPAPAPLAAPSLSTKLPTNVPATSDTGNSGSANSREISVNPVSSDGSKLNPSDPNPASSVVAELEKIANQSQIQNATNWEGCETLKEAQKKEILSSNTRKRKLSELDKEYDKPRNKKIKKKRENPKENQFQKASSKNNNNNNNSNNNNSNNHNNSRSSRRNKKKSFRKSRKSRRRH